jgi:hypothetical protein
VLPLEKKWGSAPRPFYIIGSTFDDAILAFTGRSEERRRRFFALTNTSTAANAAFVLRYNLAFPATPVTPSTAPQPSYDAFYLLAYAAYALGDAPSAGPTSRERSAGCSRPGDRPRSGHHRSSISSIGCGPARCVDLEGALGPLDLDVATGEAAVDYAVLCCGIDARGRAVGSIESGLVFAAGSGSFNGAMHCP